MASFLRRKISLFSELLHNFLYYLELLHHYLYYDDLFSLKMSLDIWILLNVVFPMNYILWSERIFSHFLIHTNKPKMILFLGYVNLVDTFLKCWNKFGGPMHRGGELLYGVSLSLYSVKFLRNFSLTMEEISSFYIFAF
uniref:hypothetical protein n=1 Tax=Exserohilum rostratum TaxID=1659837 RepID=UPI002008EBD3|nr:hypothetical protein M1U80_mgp03 [Exserohilum rostratum]UOU81307.1 hypothetical protein [Exserohilum rostratum]